MSKVLVIGSNSFSGSNFVHYLLEKGHQVIGMSRSCEADSQFLRYKTSLNRDGFNFAQVDVNHDLTDLQRVVNQEKPAKIFNFAAQSMVGQSWQYPEDWFQTNTVAFSKLIKFISGLDFIDRYVHVTTPEVYGSTSGFIKESNIYNPSTPYAISRATGDMIVAAYQKEFGLPVVSTRAANVYGAHQQLYRIIPRAILSILSGKKVPLHGGGLSERSFIHIDDVSSATYMLANDGTIGETYHISTDRIVTIRNLIELICQRLNVNFSDVVEITNDRVGKDQAYKLDSSKLRQQLPWQDKISLEQGIEETLTWVKDNLAYLSQQPVDYIHKA